MKILLVNPPASKEGVSISSLTSFEPLALEYVGAGVTDHHDVKLLDMKVVSEPPLQEAMASFQPDVVGCTACTAEVNTAKQVLAEAKKISPQVLTVIGGHHATVMPQDFFEESIDVVVVGEGVFSFKNICKQHEKKKPLADVDNIYYRTNGKMTFTRKAEHPPLDSMPIPARSLSDHLRENYKVYMLKKPATIGHIMGSYGCFYRCKFCAISNITDFKVHRRSIDKLVEELAAIEEPFIFWVDDEFFLDPKRAVDLARAIGQAGIKKDYVTLARSDTIIKNPECIEEWSKISSQLTIGVGFESHKDEDLKAMRKGTTISKNDEAVRILKANNAMIRGGFIVQQYFQKDDFKGLLDYVRKLEVDYPSFSIWTPFPGTKLYEETKDDLITDNYSLFDIVHTVLPTKMPLKQFYKQYASLVSKSFPLIKRMKRLRSLDAQTRRKMISASTEMFRRLKNSYRDYDKSLW